MPGEAPIPVRGRLNQALRKWARYVASVSRTEVEIVRRLYAAWGAGESEEARVYLDPGVVWTAIEDAPDAGTYRGHDGVLAYFNDWLQDFDDIAMEIEDTTEAEGGLVVAQHARGRGKGSGVEVDLHYAVLYEFHGAQVVRAREFRTKDAAIEAAGLCG
jgi:ketosteroid isomerase-like protein